jgi:hypothetical protein
LKILNLKKFNSKIFEEKIKTYYYFWVQAERGRGASVWSRKQVADFLSGLAVRDTRASALGQGSHGSDGQKSSKEIHCKTSK